MSRIGPLATLTTAVATPPALPAAKPVGDASFAARLATLPGGASDRSSASQGPLAPPPPDPSLTAELTTLLTQVRGDEQRLDRYVRRALSGGTFELSELVAMQTLVHRYTRKVELLSKLVDRVTGAVKQTLQTQI